jgi:hypothetical protein
MARPIEPTPVLTGKDAKRLQRELANVCTPEEARARIAHAKKSLVELTRAKFSGGGSVR